MTTPKHKRITPKAPQLIDALLHIKRLAEKSGDSEADPFTLLDLIAEHARAALNPSFES